MLIEGSINGLGSKRAVHPKIKMKDGEGDYDGQMEKLLH